MNAGREKKKKRPKICLFCKKIKVIKEKYIFFGIHLLHLFSLESFPEVGQKQKTEKKEERLKVGKITMANYA